MCGNFLVLNAGGEAMKKFQKKSRVKYPLATVTPYGPDDKTVTKLAVGIIPDEQTEHVIALERWVGTQVATSEKVAGEIYSFMRGYGVKTVVTATVVMGCPHEEGKDFESGEDCPFCPFWKGMQGSGSAGDSRWDNLKSVRVERLGISYRFWLPE